MIVMKTSSISDFKFFKSSYLASATIRETNSDLVLTIKNNIFVMIDFSKRGQVSQVEYINKTMRNVYTFKFEITEYMIKDNSETTLLCEITNIKTNETVYYAGTQRKQLFQNWKLVSQITGWNKLTKDIVTDIVKTIR